MMRHRLTPALLALVLPLLLGAAPFHLRLEKSDPADGATVTSPKAIRLWFSQPTQLPLTRITVTGPNAAKVATGAIRQDKEPKAPVEVPVPATLVPGRYQVSWRAMSADGHVVQGSFGFTVQPTLSR